LKEPLIFFSGSSQRAFLAGIAIKVNDHSSAALAEENIEQLPNSQPG